MEHKQAHSPLPWESVYPEGSKQRCAGVVSNDHYVYLSNFDEGYSRTTITMQQANADLTVKAVNAHAKLVAALKDAIPAMEYKLSHLQARQARIEAARVLEQARAVLKEGE